MALGPGKYDKLLTKARKEAKASGGLLVIMDGIHGSGFSSQLSPLDTLRLPALLRHMADQIEHDMKGGIATEKEH